MAIKKKGVFFSADALIALAVILLVIIVAVPLFEFSNIKTNVHEDVLIVLSSLKIGEIDNAQVKIWINNGSINDTNKLIIEQIGIFNVQDQNKAKKLAQIVLNESETVDNIGIWYEGELLASKNISAYENSTKVDVARLIVSGIGGLQEGGATGYSARAYLTPSFITKYFYFGGYVGDGNISIFVSKLGKINKSDMEIVIDKNFSLYVNNVNVANYSKSPSEIQPARYSIPTANFTDGNNTIEIRGKNLHITGGFIKLNYDIKDLIYEQQSKYFFPGINGLINIYDGFYAPGEINSMDIFLNMDTNYTAFLVIGNKTIYNGTTHNDTSGSYDKIYVPNSNLTKILNYTELSKKTIPIRLGLENVSYTNAGSNRPVEVLAIDDISDSMNWNCGPSHLPDPPCKINDAKSATNSLINIILDSNYDNEVGVLAFNEIARYSSNPAQSHFHALSNNNESLINEVNSWTASGGTCICCGVLRALNCYDSKILLNNFNGLPVGNKPNETLMWAVYESGGYINITDLALEGDRAVIFNLSGPGALNMSHDFSSQLGNFTIQFLIKILSGTMNNVTISLRSVDLHESSYNLNPAAQIKLDMNSSGSILSNGKIIQTPSGPLTFNFDQVYKIKIEIPFVGSYYSLYLNDVLKNNTLPISGTKYYLTRINIETKGNGQSAFIFDNLNISLFNKLCDNIDESKDRYMALMSDGEANRHCGLDNVPDWDNDGKIKYDSQDNAIEAACIANRNYGIKVYTVGFDIFANSNAARTLKNMSVCGGGNYSLANVNEISQVFANIANQIIQASYSEQTISISGNISTILYPDSYIEFNYVKEALPPGLFLTLENNFYNNYSGNFSIPDNSNIVETKAISYSGPKWTDEVYINNSKVYDISNYGNDYIKLGDPYAINIPNSYIGGDEYNNVVNVTLGVSPTNTSEGSEFNKIIYTFAKEFSAYSDIVPKIEGCKWNIEFDDGNSEIIGDSSLTDYCSYNSTIVNYSIEDASQIAVYNLLRELDFNNNNKSDYKFTEADLQIGLAQTSGIPFITNAEVQVRVWR